MTAGRVHPKKDGKTVATCANCDEWTYETIVEGEAAHKLMEHNAEEHAQ